MNDIKDPNMGAWFLYGFLPASLVFAMVAFACAGAGATCVKRVVQAPDGTQFETMKSIPALPKIEAAVYALTFVSIVTLVASFICTAVAFAG